jgi:hypothetical protein
MKRPRYAEVVATLALVIALATGGAYAASKLGKNTVGPRQVKNGSLTGKEIKDNALGGVDIDESSLSLPLGPTGPAGPRGATGPDGPFVSALPSGKTLTGHWSSGGIATGVSQPGFGAISFPFPLATQPTGQLVGIGGPSTQQCPGTVDQPAAAPGSLCVYVGSTTRVTAPASVELCDASGTCSQTRATKYGITVETFSNGSGFFVAFGTWAVTAP